MEIKLEHETRTRLTVTMRFAEVKQIQALIRERTSASVRWLAEESYMFGGGEGPWRTEYLDAKHLAQVLECVMAVLSHEPQTINLPGPL